MMESSVPLVETLEKLVWPDGHESWTLSSKMPLCGGGGEIIGTFGIARDVTAARKTEKALKDAHKELVEAARLPAIAIEEPGGSMEVESRSGHGDGV